MSTRSSSTLPRPASGNFHSFLFFFGSLSYVHPIPLVKIMYFTFSINIVQHATPVMTRTAAENVKAAGLSVWQQEQITIVDTSGGQAGYDVHQWWANTSKHHGLVLLWNDEYVLNRYSVRRNCSVHALYVTVVNSGSVTVSGPIPSSCICSYMSLGYGPRWSSCSTLLSTFLLFKSLYSLILSHDESGNRRC